MDDLLVNLRNNIRILRVAAGETQAALGRVLFVDRKTVSSYESGRTVPDLLTLIRIADHYCISVDDLLRKDLQSP
ncbi:MAG: helix-turn-helix transcriptional regulator [Firmicutes bacterium]|nr:helix-turn-helix transcriptional regulator [Bacillota bacterium]